MNKVTEREKQILKILQNDPMIAQEDLAQIMNITRSAVAVHISNLIKKGYILGRGYVFNDRTGVLVVGTVYMDVEAVTDGGVSGDIEIRPGGAGFNISQHLCSQSVPTSLISVIGRDEWGELVTEAMLKSGVDSRYLTIQNEYPTPRRISIANLSSNTQQVISDNRALQLLSPDRLQSLGVTVSKCKMLVIDAAIASETLQYVVDLGKGAEISVGVQLSEEGLDHINESKLPGLSLLTMTAATAGQLLSSRVKDLEDCVSCSKRLSSQGIGTVVIVMPNQGLALSGPGETMAVPLSPGHDEKNRISLDMITAGMVQGILKGYDSRSSGRTALASAVRVVDK